MDVDSLLEQGSGKMNEDAFVIKDSLFGVFDGGTSIVKYLDESGKTGGALASGIVKNVFEREEGSLWDVSLKANAAIKDEMVKRNIDISKKVGLWCTTVAAIKLGKDSFDWIQIADSLIIVVYNDGSYKLLIEDYDQDEETLVRWKELAEKKEKNIRDTIMKNQEELRNDSNVWYGVMNGEEEMVKFLKKGTESLENVKHILIFTDGLFIPKEDPRQKDDFDTFVKLFLEGGLKKIRDHVRELEKPDPECWKYPRYKQHDDIAAIAISF